MQLKDEFKDIEKVKALLQKPEQEVLPHILTPPFLGKGQKNPNNWLTYAASEGMAEHVDVLLKSPFAKELLRASVDRHKKTALDWAVEKGYDSIALMLIEHEAPLSASVAADIYKKDEKLFAAFTAKKGYISHLLSPPAGGAEETNWLCLAAYDGDMTKVGVLLRNPMAKTLVQAPGAAGSKPLHLALGKKHHEVASALFKFVDDISPVESEWMISSLPLISHIVADSKEPPKFAYSFGKNDNWLTYAAWQGATKIVEILLGSEGYRKALLDLPGEQGFTALEWALKREKFDTALEIMKHNPKIPSKETAQMMLGSGHAGLIAAYRATEHFEKSQLAISIQAYLRGYLTRQAFFPMREAALERQEAAGIREHMQKDKEYTSAEIYALVPRS